MSPNSSCLFFQHNLYIKILKTIMITSLISNIITILVLVNLTVIFAIRKAYANGVFTIDVNKSLLTPIYYAAKMTLGVEAEKGSYAVSMSFMGYRLIIKAKQ